MKGNAPVRSQHNRASDVFALGPLLIAYGLADYWILETSREMPDRQTITVRLFDPFNRRETHVMKDTAKPSSLGTVVYGLLIIVPVAILFLLLVKMTEILEKVAKPLGLESNFGAAITLFIIAMIAVLFVLVCAWFVGSITRRVVSFEKFEATVLNGIPGYPIIANVVRGFSEGKTSYPPALVELHGPGAATLGFIMEEHPNDRVTVYIPSVPVLTVGTLFVVERERITRLEAGAKEVADCISQWGIGSQKILGNIDR